MFSTNKILTNVLIAALSLGYSLSGRAVEFASAVRYAVGTSPAAVAIADFTGDGKADLAVANSGSGNVSVLVNNGDGTYRPARNFDAGMPSPTSIEAADFNNDGIQDLAVWNLSGPVGSTVSILLGNGDGTFQAPKTTPLPATVDQATLDLVIADFNLDHKPDLALLMNNANGGTSAVVLLAGNGDGTFQAPQQSSVALSTEAGSNAKYFVWGDFNNDSKPDLAVQVSGGLQILLGEGDGTFQSGPTVPLAGGFAVSDLMTGDFNGDGKVDLITRSSGSEVCGMTGMERPEYAATWKISLLLGNGDGSFQAESVIDAAHACHFFLYNLGVPDAIGTPSSGDFNGDGALDLLYQYQITNFTGRLVTVNETGVRLGRTGATFSAPAPIDGFLSASRPSNTIPWGVSFVTKDLNADKLDDVVYLDGGSNEAVVLLNTSPKHGADLGIVKTAVGRALSDPSSNYWYPKDGRSFSFSAEVLNEGPQAATGVTYAETLPAGVTLVSATASQGSCNQSGGAVTCAIGSMASGVDATVTVAVILNPTTSEETLASDMKVIANEPDLDLANNTGAASEPVFTLTVSTDGTGSGAVTDAVAGPTGAGIAAGINCGDTCAQGYLGGSVISLTATPASGSVFTGWDGNTSAGTETVTMWGSQTIRARFDKLDPPPISGGGSGGGACNWWELCGMLLVGLSRRLSVNRRMIEDRRGV